MILLNTLVGDISIKKTKLEGSLTLGSLSLSGDIVCGGTKQYPPYDGSYTVTPGSEEQVLETAEKSLSQNIVIDPIPSNYGLISWNGSTLTVS